MGLQCRARLGGGGTHAVRDPQVRAAGAQTQAAPQGTHRRQRWTPFFGQVGGAVKVDSVWLVGTRREPLNPSGVPGSGVDNKIRCAPSKLSTFMFSGSSVKGRAFPVMGSLRRPAAARILPSACGHRQGSSEVVPRCSSASTHRSSDERGARPGKRAGKRTRI